MSLFDAELPCPPDVEARRELAALRVLPRVCVAIVIEDSGDCVLLLKRSATSTFPESWCLPGGRLEPGETLEDCCCRELAEETGLFADRFRLECVTETIVPHHLIGLVYYAVGIWGQAANLEPERHDEIGWFARDEFPKPLMPGVAQWLALTWGGPRP